MNLRKVRFVFSSRREIFFWFKFLRSTRRVPKSGLQRRRETVGTAVGPTVVIGPSSQTSMRGFAGMLNLENGTSRSYFDF